MRPTLRQLEYIVEVADCARFGQAAEDARDTHLVGHFCSLACAGRADRGNGLGIGFHGGPGARHRIVGAAAHDGELSIDCARLSAADRRIDKGNTFRLAGRAEFAGHVGRGGGVIDPHDLEHCREALCGSIIRKRHAVNIRFFNLFFQQRNCSLQRGHRVAVLL